MCALSNRWPHSRHLMRSTNSWLWRAMLSRCTVEAVEAGHLDPDLDVDQLVWELSGIYLSHHASVRFLNDPEADRRAETALSALFERAGAQFRA